MNAFFSNRFLFVSLATGTGSEANKKRTAAEQKAALKAAAKKEAAEKRRLAAEERKKEQNEKKQLMAAGRKAASLAAKTLQSLSDVCKNVGALIAEATGAPHNMDSDHPQIKSLQTDLEIVESWRKGASATLAAQAKCSGKPLPLLPFENEKQCSNKIKAVKGQMAALKIILKPKRPSRKTKEEQPEG